MIDTCAFMYVCVLERDHVCPHAYWITISRPLEFVRCLFKAKNRAHFHAKAEVLALPLTPASDASRESTNAGSSWGRSCRSGGGDAHEGQQASRQRAAPSERKGICCSPGALLRLSPAAPERQAKRPLAALPAGAAGWVAG